MIALVTDGRVLRSKAACLLHAPHHLHDRQQAGDEVFGRLVKKGDAGGEDSLIKMVRLASEKQDSVSFADTWFSALVQAITGRLVVQGVAAPLGDGAAGPAAGAIEGALEGTSDSSEEDDEDEMETGAGEAAQRRRPHSCRHPSPLQPRPLRPRD